MIGVVQLSALRQPRNQDEMQKYVLDKVYINSRGPIVPRAIHDVVVVHSRFVFTEQRTTTEMRLFFPAVLSLLDPHLRGCSLVLPGRRQHLSWNE